MHSELSRVYGRHQTSPIRVHTQAPVEQQFPEGYGLYSGHLDWETYGNVPSDRFVFTILRDPYERIASFYFYLYDKSLKLSDAELSKPENLGLQRVRYDTAEQYFFAEDPSWNNFIVDHYDNFYCSYFATRRVRGAHQLKKLTDKDVIYRAIDGTNLLNKIYSIDNLVELENDILDQTGTKINVVGKRVNSGPTLTGQRRWPALLKLIHSEESRDRLFNFARKDIKLISKLKAIGKLK